MPFRDWIARIPWPLLAGGWLAAYLVGLALGFVLMLTSDWESGAEWERATLVLAHRTVSPAMDAVFLWLPLVGTNTAWPRSSRSPRSGCGAEDAKYSPSTSPQYRPKLDAQHCHQIHDPRPPRPLRAPGPICLPRLPQRPLHRRRLGPRHRRLALRASHGTQGYWVVRIFRAELLLPHIQVHWPTDVIGGTLVSALWLGVTLKAFAPLHEQGDG